MNPGGRDNENGPAADRATLEAQSGDQTDIIGKLLPYGVGTVIVALVLLWVAKQFFGEYIKILAGRRSDGGQRSFARGRRFTRRQLTRYQLTRYRKSIRESHHKVLAMECLAEARRIDSGFAEMIIQHFRSELDHPGPDQAAITAAFGAVAADARPRGQQVLALLRRTATEADQPARGLAMQALSASGRLEAAEALARMAEADEDARNALRGMGELALPVLTANAAKGWLWAVDDLGIVGTLTAATALTRLLWLDDQDTAKRAAWRGG